MEGRLLLIVGIDAWVSTVVRYLAKKKMRGGLSRNKYDNANENLKETTTKELIGNIKEFVMIWFRKEVILEEIRLGSGERRNPIFGTLKTTTNVRKIPSVRTNLISVAKRWFRTYVMDAFGSVNNSYSGKVLEDGHIEM